MPPDLALLSTLISSNHSCLQLIFMIPKVFEPLQFDCIDGSISRRFQDIIVTELFVLNYILYDGSIDLKIDSASYPSLIISCRSKSQT